MPKPGDPEVKAWLDKQGRAVGRGYTSDGVHVIELDGVARFLFRSDGPEVLALRSPEAPPQLVEEYFRRWILPLAVQARGLEVLHASAVVGPSGIAAFSAPSEAGKSTLAYGLVMRGYPVWTDDALAFDAAESEPRTFPLPFRLRLRPPSAKHFGLEPREGGTIVAESDIDLGEPRRIAAVFLLERRSGGPPVQLDQAHPIEAFPALLEGSYHFGSEQGERKRALLSRYLDLAARVPVFRLSLATGLTNLDEALDAVEELL